MREYDIEILVSICKKYEQRFRDFKKYGIINVKNKKVLVNLLVERDDKIDDLESGWHSGVDVNVVRLGGNYVTNTFNFFVNNIDVSNPRSRWVMKCDDDSYTDIDGLIKNLEDYYDYRKPFYLGANLKYFDGGPEISFVNKYWDLMHNYKKIHRSLKHEMEACIWSIPAIKNMLENERSLALLKRRGEIEEGATDVCFAFASALIKQYPIDCPFLTFHPNINDFSLFGLERRDRQIKNHIHMISRDGYGENFKVHDKLKFSLISQFLEETKDPIKEKICNKKYILELQNEIKIYKFNENNTVNIKSGNQNWLWCSRNEEKEEVVLFDCHSMPHFLQLDQKGNMKGKIENRDVELYMIDVAN